jgi:nucleotide-binding universal stress UspA family protein
MITIKNVLVATDFGEASQVALEYGRHVARLTGAALHVLHVVRHVVADTIGVEGYTVDVEAFQKALEKAAREQLEAIVTRDDRNGLAADTVIVTSNSPARSIVAYAKDAQIDLIVLGTHGRGGVAHLFMGSVAERVVRTAPCPVLTVRQPEREPKSPEAMQATARV